MFYFNFNRVCKNIAFYRNFSNLISKVLTEHCGYQLKVSLCIDRQPLEYTESEIDRLFREFKELWCFETKNSLKLPSISLLERKITHKLARSKDRPGKQTISDTPGTTTEYEEQEDLESLLTSELDIKLLPRRTRRVSGSDFVKRELKEVSDDDMHNPRRLPKSWVFLLFKYKNSQWSLPTTDLYYGDSVRQTLVKLCEEQISPSYKPYFLGFSPFTHQILPFKQDFPNSEIEGEKIFYYRARHLPSLELGKIVGEQVEDFAWCTFDELQVKLDKFKHHKVLNSLPIYNC